jgi:hypothetical protein
VSPLSWSVSWPPLWLKMLSPSLRSVRSPFWTYGSVAKAWSEMASSKKSWEVNSRPLWAAASVRILKLDMDRTTLVPARVDGGEGGRAVGVPSRSPKPGGWR